MIFLEKYWSIILAVYFIGYLFTYSIAAINDRKKLEKEKAKYGEDLIIEDYASEVRENRIYMAILWPISVVYIIISHLFNLIFFGSAKMCDEIILRKKNGGNNAG